MNFLSQKEMLSLVDVNAYSIIEYLLRKVTFSQPELSNNNQKNSGIQITKEFLEQWIVQACDLKSIGSGNYPIDVYKENEYGTVEKFVSAGVDKKGQLLNSQSNETSLGQNFQGFGKYLDQAFENKDYDKILNGWIKILKDKLSKPFTQLNLHTIYYFIFIRSGNKICLAISKLDLDYIQNLTVKKTSPTSVFVDNFLNPKYGEVKIYKSKKRMELRLYAKKLQENNLLITWDFKNLKPSIVSLREIAQKNQLNDHINSEFQKFFDT